MTLRRRHLLALAAAAATPLAFAQAYPERPIKLIVAFAAGSATDIMARAYAEKLKEGLGQPIVVENRPGAAGAIGAELAAKSPADGYTLLLNTSAMAISPWVSRPAFDFQKDLVPIARAADTPYVLTVDARLPIRSLDELIAHARSQPGKLACATYGIASPPHLALELLKASAGVDIVHVPYRTFAQALPDLMSGQLQCSIDVPTSPAPHVRAGKLRALAHTGAAPMEAYPTAQPFGQRYPQATVVGWQAIFAPAGTPPAIVARLRTEWAKVLASPDITQKIRDAGFQPSGLAMEPFTAEIAADHAKFGRIIKERNIRLE